LAAFAQFASDLDENTRKQIERGQRVTQCLMKQKQYQPLTISEMAVSLYAANEGYLDDVDVKKVVDFEHALHSYMRANHAELLAKTNKTGDYTGEIVDGFKAAWDDFKANHSW
jgi:F-type H+-transporting ATPase subunit alpha